LSRQFSEGLSTTRQADHLSCLCRTQKSTTPKCGRSQKFPAEKAKRICQIYLFPLGRVVEENKVTKHGGESQETEAGHEDDDGIFEVELSGAAVDDEQEFEAVRLDQGAAVFLVVERVPEIPTVVVKYAKVVAWKTVTHEVPIEIAVPRNVDADDPAPHGKSRDIAAGQGHDVPQTEDGTELLRWITGLEHADGALAIPHVLALIIVAEPGEGDRVLDEDCVVFKAGYEGALLVVERKPVNLHRTPGPDLTNLQS
jgi:hypothetical protein